MKRTLILAVASLLALSACSKSETEALPAVQLAPRVTITSIKGDATSELLAAIYARALEKAGIRVVRKEPVELDQAGLAAALAAGEIQLVPQFSGDALSYALTLGGTDTTAVTNTTEPAGPATTQAPIATTTTTIPSDTTVAAPDTTAASDTTAPTETTGATDTTVAPTPVDDGRSLVAQMLSINSLLPTSLAVIGATAAEHKQVIACTTDILKANSSYEFTTLTNLASLAPGIRLGAPASFLGDTVDGWAAWERTYGGEFSATVPVEAAGLADAITNNAADCFVLDSLDPLIATKSLNLLTDDRFMVSTNAVLAFIASVANTAEVTTALEPLATALTTEALNRMLNEITANGTDPIVVANAFVDNL